MKGLGDGVGLEDFATRAGKGAMPSPPSPFPPGENLDGTVPALARRVCGKLSGVGRWEKSGKLSVGDSGIFSRKGVDPPLVGGPHTPTGRPSCACISRALLVEYNALALPSCSCDGEPAPDREFPDILPAEFNPPERPNGDLRGLPLEASVGEVFAVEDPERD